MDFIRNFLQFPMPSVSVSMKLPKFKKLRQWSNDLSQLTLRSTNMSNTKQNENPLPTNGITTISSAINEQKIDPKKDNFGLYALKCDRSKTLANARRGILLNLPSTKIKSKIETSNYQSVEQNHEIFQSCEILQENDNDDNEGSNLRPFEGMNQQKEKIEPPPRKKKKIIAPHISALHQKPKQNPPQPPPTRAATSSQQMPHVNRAGQSTTITMDNVEKNDSGLYRIIAPKEVAKITYVEPKKPKAVTIMKPKVERAVIVKTTPVIKQIAKVKDYEWNKHQRRPSKGNIKKIEVKKYAPSGTIESKKPNDSVDIFKSNRLSDQKKLFDEFDELFEKNKALNESINQTPESAFKKLSELKKSSSTFLSESGCEEIKELSLIKVKGMDDNKKNNEKFYDKNLARTKYVNSLLQSEENDDDDHDVVVDYVSDNDKQERKIQEENLKPKIISEQVKKEKQSQQHVEMNKKKIMYYDDENELQELIMKRMQTTTTKTEMKLSSTTNMSNLNVKDYDTKEYLNENKTSLDYKHPTQLISTNENSTNNNKSGNSSNSLRRTIFVFNL